MSENALSAQFQSPRGDFGFLKLKGLYKLADWPAKRDVSIPSRGFWFFEDAGYTSCTHSAVRSGFNPLAGILVF